MYWLPFIFFPFKSPFDRSADTRDFREIQGDSNISPYNNSFAKSQNNIVTLVSDDFFIIQTPDKRADAAIQTSNALVVLEDNFDIEVGDLGCRGICYRIYSNGTTILLAEDIATQVVSQNNPLPSTLLVDAAFPIAERATVSAWEWVEAMLINLKNFVITAPSDDDGFCYVTASENRPFREPGIEFPGINGLPQWDGNPEVLPFFPEGFGLAPNRLFGAGMSLNGIGILLGENQDYALYPITYGISGNYRERAARPKAAMEASIACLNALFLLTSDTEYSFRIQKTARYIVEKMQLPDIIALQEIGSLTVLQDLVEEIASIDDTQIYTAHFRQGSGSIHTGYLIKNTVSGIQVEQLGENESLSIGGRKHDRPPLLLKAQLNTEPPTPIAVLNVHLRSLNGIVGNDQTFVRTKRHEAAISVANMIKALQLQYDNIVVVGDFNAFQFSDGYVDVVNQITGQNSLGAQFEVEEVIDIPLVNQSLSVSQEEQYSYIFGGNAQILDHCLSSSEMNRMEVVELQYIRGNADNPEIFLSSNPSLRVSDHDGFVLYLGLEDTLGVTPGSLVPPLFCRCYYPPQSLSAK